MLGSISHLLFLLQCKHAMARVVTRSKASEVQCFPAPLWTHSNKADGANYLHNKMEIGIFFLGEAFPGFPGNASPKSYVLRWAEVPDSNQATGMSHAAKWHLCHDSQAAKGWTAALQFQDTPAREQHELPSYCDTQKSNNLSPVMHSPFSLPGYFSAHPTLN